MNAIINVANTIESPICDKAEDGQKIFELAKKTIQDEKETILTFINTEIVTSEFLEVAIANLYYDFPTEEIKKYLHIENLPITGAVSLKRVVEKAKTQVDKS